MVLAHNPGEREWYQSEEPEELELSEGVTDIGDYAFAGCRRLVRAKLPQSVKRIGKHAFYNCRNLAELEVGGYIGSVEDGAFRNCERLSLLRLLGVEEERVCLKAFLSDLEQELTVQLVLCTGEEARLFLPRTSYEFVANEPARMFSEVSHGSGQLFRQCVASLRMDWERYDALFPVACREERPSTVFAIAVGRLRFPYRLSVRAKQVYSEYLAGQGTELLSWLAETEDWEVLRFLCGEGIVGKAQLPAGIRIAGEKNCPYLASLLLDCVTKGAGSAGRILEL